MSLSTMYIIAVSIVPAALGILLLTSASVAGLRSRAGRSQLARYQPSLAAGSETASPGVGALFHRGATQ